VSEIRILNVFDRPFTPCKFACWRSSQLLHSRSAAAGLPGNQNHAEDAQGHRAAGQPECDQRCGNSSILGGRSPLESAPRGSGLGISRQRDRQGCSTDQDLGLFFNFADSKQVVATGAGHNLPRIEHPLDT
jgi:hypothetical protein